MHEHEREKVQRDLKLKLGIFIANVTNRIMYAFLKPASNFSFADLQNHNLSKYSCNAPFLPIIGLSPSVANSLTVSRLMFQESGYCFYHTVIEI